MKYLATIIDIVRKESKIIYYHTAFCLLLGLISAGGLVLDDRTLLGVNVWLKPFKFCVSTAIYVFTVGYLTQLYDYTTLKKAVINHLTAWTLSAELAIIVLQGARGVQSHYNESSLVDGLLFAAMGLFIGVNVLLMGLFLFDTLRGKAKVGRTMKLALVLGWVCILGGSYVGGQMISQVSHTVGLADGGVGMPLINWSLRGGDLRIAHFFGIHGLQIIPIAAYFASKKWIGSQHYATVFVSLFGLAYMALIALTFYQAKLGMPLIALSLL